VSRVASPGRTEATVAGDGLADRRARYDRERDLRLRADGPRQYRSVVGPFARYLDDPNVARGDASNPGDAVPVARPARDDLVDVVVVGAGFGGLLLGARLAELGIHDVLLVDRAGDVGGTWYWNRYPGARCDVDATVYLPLLDEVGTDPGEQYAAAPVIQGHARAIARQYGLDRRVLVQTTVTDCRWDDDARRWVVRTDRGDALRARFLCTAVGPLDRPKLPGVPGIETFRGWSFHTARWDYRVTGGRYDAPLDRLAGQRVGVIGTGASAVQCMPRLAETAGHLYVFQRTPSAIEPLASQPVATIIDREPGWQRRRIDAYNRLFDGAGASDHLVEDGWTAIVAELVERAASSAAADDTEVTVATAAALLERADLERMARLHDAIDQVVDDPATAEALKPWYRQFCKRPCFSDEYLPTFNRDNVTLIDTRGRGVDRITATGAVVGERHIRLDGLIFATGFEMGTPLAHRAGYEIRGRGRATMTDAHATGPSTLHGYISRGFPNCFVLRSVQAATTINHPHLLDELATHVAHVIATARAAGATTVEPTADAEAAWVATIADQPALSDGARAGCTPGYHNLEGARDDGAGARATYPGGSVAFFALLDAWRRDGTLAGLELTTGSAG
jgi:cation diffusion facilitator CzcD-associated flavoprotein CzcO